MQNFRNILFVSNGTDPGKEALNQALTLAMHNKSPLTVLINYPKFPEHLNGSLQDYEEFMTSKVKKEVENACVELKFKVSDLNINFIAEGGQSPAIRIIRHVEREAYDILIKQAEESKKGNGYKAIDMELLRKCPCPVFLCKSTLVLNKPLKIAVAIDAESVDSVGHDLSIQLVQLARTLSENYNSELSIVSCWFYEYEAELSQGSWYAISKEALQKIVGDIQEKHKFRFDTLIKESAIRGDFKTCIIKGKPDKEIPNFVTENKIDILVMGTVARTGIQGLLIGNTAENILQQLECSLLAKKPNGFVSTVKPY